MAEFRVWNGTAGWIARLADEVPSNSNGSFVGFYMASCAQDAIAQAMREHPEIE